MTSTREEAGPVESAPCSASEPGSDRGADRRQQFRSHTDANIVVSTPDGEFVGTTANLSYTGVLALLPRSTVPVGTAVSINLSNPLVELDLTVSGKVVHCRPCDGGVTAQGIQLQYPADRIEEVMAFIEFLQKFDRAGRNGVVSGSIDAGGLGPVLDLFVNTAPSGTLDVRRGEEIGKIVFSENYLLRCVLGMVTGVKALARMFRWTEGRFEFHHDLQFAGAEPEPQAVETAVMMASVEKDEIDRIADNGFCGAATFAVGEGAANANREGLSEIEQEVLDYANDGFSVEAVSDMISAADADIWKAFHVLVNRGNLRLRD